MPTSLSSGILFTLAQAAPQPAPVPRPFDIAELLSASANYLSEMQTTVTILAVVVAAVTVIVGIFGALLTIAGYRAQREAQEEIRQFRTESRKEITDRHTENKKEIADRHESHNEEIKLLHEAGKTNIQMGLSNLREELIATMEKKVERIEHMYSSEIIQKLETVESDYASNLRHLEDILVTFQEECNEETHDGRQIFDFPRYNTFRHLLIRLVSGGRLDTHNALCRVLEEYVPNVGESTAVLVRSLIVELRESGRISRTDLRILAGDVIHGLNTRFPPIDIELADGEPGPNST
jgi:hypothetical protein